MTRPREDEYQRVVRELAECGEALDLAEQSNARERERAQRAEALNRDMLRQAKEHLAALADLNDDLGRV